MSCCNNPPASSSLFFIKKGKKEKRQTSAPCCSCYRPRPPPDLAKRLASQGRRGAGHQGMKKQVVHCRPFTPAPPRTHTSTPPPLLPSRCHKINVISRVFFPSFLFFMNPARCQIHNFKQIDFQLPLRCTTSRCATDGEPGGRRCLSLRFVLFRS